MQPKSRRLVTEQNLETYTERELAPVASKSDTALDQSSQALSVAQGSNTKSDNAITRVEQVETIAGLGPGEVTDAQTANLISQKGTITRTAFGATLSDEINTPESPGRQSMNTVTAEIVWDVPGPTGAQETDVAMVLAAAQKAVDEGRKKVTMAPGHYDLEGVTVDDIQDRYLVGDNVTFTMRSWVYPFASSDTVENMQPKSTGTRGRIAIELDDANADHWYFVFPLAKELGITMGTAWHTDNGAQWIKEAHRHGWEVLSHLPENITAVQYRDEGILDQVAQRSLNAVAEIVGTTENIGFVYPQHARDDDTDRILSKYYNRGRAFRNAFNYPKGEYHPWVTSSEGIDKWNNHGHLTEELKMLLDNIANIDGQLVFYAHSNYSTYEARNQAIRELVAYARHLGIEFVNSGQIWADHNIAREPYFEDDYWEPSGSASFDDAVAYHGARSVRFDLAEGNGLISGTSYQQLPSKAGMFTVLKLSFRYKVDEPAEFTSAGGFSLSPRFGYKTESGNPPFEISGTGLATTPFLPFEGDTIQPAEWEKVETLIYVEPSALQITPRLMISNGTNDASVWVDELKVEHVGHVPEVKYSGKMAGTGIAPINTAVPRVSAQNLKILPTETPTGSIRIHSNTHSNIRLTSTSAEDTMDVDVYISPTGRYA